MSTALMESSIQKPAEEQATDSDNSPSQCYASVIENRAKEVGLAVFDLPRLTLRLTQFVEAGRSYTTTQLMLHACQPRHLVVVGSNHHEVAGGTGVNQITAGAWEQVQLTRSCFDDTKGILAVQELAEGSLQGSSTIQQVNYPANHAEAVHKTHYLAYGAAGALLHHVRHNLGLVLAPRTIQVEFTAIKHHMSLDRPVITALNILAATKQQTVLQKTVASNISNGVAAFAQKQQGAHAGNFCLGPRGGMSQPIGQMHADDAGEPKSYARRSRNQRAQQGLVTFDYRTSSLFGFLNHTTTAAGARLLRTNLLQPLTDIITLELRLDSLQVSRLHQWPVLWLLAKHEVVFCTSTLLQELLESPHLTLELATLMESLPKNLDKVCSNLALQPQAAVSSKDPSTRLGRLVSSTILLRDVLRCLPVMADAMAWVESDLLKAIRANFGHADLKQLLQDIEAVLDDDAQASKSQFVNKVQQCFAVKAQVDSFLDLSRASFTRLTESVHELAANYRASTGLSTLKVQYSSSKGFYLVVPEPSSGTSSMHRQAGGKAQKYSSAAPAQLPKTFLVLEKRGRNNTCVTTHELNALNSRLRDAAADCMLLTVQVLDKVISRLLQHMPLLQRMLDNIALLDVLISFFHAVTGSDGDFCRPTFTESGPLAITKGRHPMLQAVKDPGFDCKPNDTYITPSCTLHLLTGPNMSGKSTYLKQVALLVVMAQIGCYVPATFMSLSPYESIHTRIGTCDNIECNASSFMVEMADMAQLLSRAGPRSLVLIDELGRATSTCDGVALCWSMSEYLLAVGAHVLLATHFRQLEELAAVYPSCKLWRMQVSVNNSDIHYDWKIAPAAQAADDDATGANGRCHYGILLAQTVGLPAGITNKALQIAELLEQKQEQISRQQQQDNSTAQLRQVYSLVHKLGCVARQVAEGVGMEPPGRTAATSVSGTSAAVQSVLPLLKTLKQEAESILLAAAR